MSKLAKSESRSAAVRNYSAYSRLPISQHLLPTEVSFLFPHNIMYCIFNLCCCRFPLPTFSHLSLHAPSEGLLSSANFVCLLPQQQIVQLAKTTCLMRANRSRSRSAHYCRMLGNYFSFCLYFFT